MVAFSVRADVLANKQVTLWLDNHAVAQLINNNSAKCPRVLVLLQSLVRCQLEGNMAIRARHVAGVHNEVADTLSRFQWVRFRSLAPRAEQEGTTVPGDLWQLVEAI